MWNEIRKFFCEDHVKESSVTIITSEDRACIRNEEAKKLRERIVELTKQLSELANKAKEGIEKPKGPYRIYKREVADGEEYGQPEGYYVQKWRVHIPAFADRFREYYVPRKSIEEELIAKIAYIEKKIAEHPKAYIVWDNVGSVNPHATYADAKEWLNKWLNPKTEEVFFDEKGNEVK